jgi:hypothetical protein
LPFLQDVAAIDKSMQASRVKFLMLSGLKG